jgi:hypothetical protein
MDEYEATTRRIKLQTAQLKLSNTPEGPRHAGDLSQGLIVLENLGQQKEGFS